MESYYRGSEWSRWDLHVHTPGTNKNDQFEGTSSEDKWNRFYEKVFLSVLYPIGVFLYECMWPI